MFLHYFIPIKKTGAYNTPVIFPQTKNYNYKKFLSDVSLYLTTAPQIRSLEE